MQTAPAPDEPVLECQGLVKRRADGERQFAACIQHLIVRRGDRIAFLGRNGSGKSTLINVLALAMHPNFCGSLRYGGSGGFDAARAWRRGQHGSLAAARRQYVSYLPQSLGLLEFLTAEENIQYAARLGRARGVHIDTIVETLNIGPLRHAYPKALSGGQRQRVAAACALARKPAILFADEPSAALDEQHAVELMASLCAVTTAQNVALVMATHDQHLLDSLGFRLFEMVAERRGPGEVRSDLREIAP